MPTWLRIVLAIATGFIVWFVVATVGNFGIRWVFPGYTEVERGMQFSTGMLFARLALGAVASVAAGASCIVIGRNLQTAIYLFASLLLALFVLIHVGLWANFPVWYHITFLGSLVPFVALGARLPGWRAASAT
jgi:hypothetical protein